MVDPEVNTPSISVVLPAYNAADWLPGTLEKLRTALSLANWANSEIIIVDDGSTDNTAAVLATDAGFPSLKVLRQDNAGRFRARHAGLCAASGEYVLFIDSRVHAHAASLDFLVQQLTAYPDRRVWNGHVETAEGSSPFSSFWDGITFLAWRRYLGSPRLMSYSLKDYDYYPKGTTFFLAPRDWLLEACDSFESLFDDMKNSNDDTLMIRPLAARAPIFLSPDFSCTYFPRDNARSFLSHSRHRGTVFVDGYYRPGTRFYRPLQVLLVVTPLALFFVAARPVEALLLMVAGCAGLLGLARWAGVPKRSARSLALLAPLFAASYGSGIVRGLLLRSRHGAGK